MRAARELLGRRRLTGAAAAVAAAGSILAALAALAALPEFPALSAPAPAAGVPNSAFGSDWPVYHHDPAGSGVDSSGTDLSSVVAAWTSPALDGDLFGEPLVEAGRVVAATENDTVYAVAADSGAVLWSTHVGTPVPQSKLACGGDIGPVVGITGTPVIDAARAEVFAVADELSGSTAVFHLVGLDLYSGVVLLDQVLSLPGADTLAQLQRTGLNLVNGSVVVGFGGLYGDCGNYHGWAVAVPENGGAQQAFEVDSGAGERQGAIWMGGAAPEVDAQGKVWLATGNGSNTSSSSPYDDSDGVLELSPAMQLEAYFSPSTWYSDNASDLDLGSAAPALLGDGTVFQAGKSQKAYLLSQASPGGIGGQLASQGSFCGTDVDGGMAVSGSVVYVPCMAGVEAVQTSASPPSISVQWQTSTGAGGPPIVAGGLVWTISSGGTLFGLDPSTGDAVHQFAVGAGANHFPTPSVADGLLLAPSATEVHAFAGPAGLPPPPSAPPPRQGYRTVAADGGVFAFSAPFDGSMGGQHLNGPMVAMAADTATGGYWLVAADGGIFAFDAPFEGSMGGQHLNAPVVGMASDPSTGGYWLVAADGGIFAFDAPFHGSMGGQHLNAPIVGMAADTATGGYWLVAADGGVFAFDAPFDGSMGGQRLNAEVAGMAADPSSSGYWLVAGDGGIFAFDAPFDGSMGGQRLNAPVVGMAAVPSGSGYWLVGSDGGVFAFDAPFWGSTGGEHLNAPMVGIAAGPPPG